MSGKATLEQSPWIFFALVFALSVPLWIVGEVTGQLLPLDLPFGALMAFNPLIAAVLLIYRREGGAHVNELLRKSVDPRGIAASWLAIAILLMPIILVFEFGFLRITGAAIPDPSFSVSTTLLFCVMFFVAAIGEEAGWQGYAAVLLQQQYTALTCSLILGLVWAVWHVVPFIQADRSPSWIWWQCLTMLPARIIIVWLSNNTGRSVLIAVLFHTMMNLSEYMFPNYGSHYDPFVTFVILAAVAATIIVLWGSQTLERYRQASQKSNHRRLD
jgi:uncharacterized protein